MTGSLEDELAALFPAPEEGLRSCLAAAVERLRREEPEAPPTTLRSPALFGRLLLEVLAHPRLSAKAKRHACWTVFDVIPLPETEDEAFATPERVPPGLQEAARFLWKVDDFVEYHLLHLVYALYLDPARAAAAPLRVLRENLEAILAETLDERVKLLYAYLLLAAPSHGQEEAGVLFEALLENPHLPDEVKRYFCLAALDRRFSEGWFVSLASAEGLYPPEEGRMAEILRQARVRPLPASLATRAEAWLLQHGVPGEPSSGEQG